MVDITVTVLLGALGGLIRASIGLRKAILARQTFKPGYFLSTVVMAAVIGAAVGSTLGTSPFVALVCGYAGSDLLEGVAKAIKLMPLNV